MLGSTVDTSNSGTVGGYIASESPFFAQYIRQQHLVRRAWQTAVCLGISLSVRIHLRGVKRERIVGSHDRLDIRLTHRSLESRQVILTHVLLVGERSSGLTPCLVVVSGKVLGTSHYLQVVRSSGAIKISTLEASHERHRQFGGQVRVFAVVLFLTPPTRVTRHVDSRRPVVESLARIQIVTACLVRGDGGTVIDKFAIPCSRHTFALGEGGRCP